ncbi:MAG: hypothetical protein WA081_02390 [Desulfosalsimonadaceae bacterium]
MVTPANHVIIVLGMYRTGTSALAGCLQILGADFGNAIMADSPVKTAGRYGNNEIVSIHDNLLSNLGCRWDMIGNLPDGWVDSPAADIAKEDIMGIFQRNFSGSDLWAVTDPRICRLMPLWLDVFRKLNIAPVFIHMVRHPCEVAESLNVCDGMDLRKGHLLWMVYNRDALSGCNGHRHTLVTYDQLLADPVTTLIAVSEKLEMAYPFSMDSRYQQIIEFVRPERKHRHHSQADHLAAFSHFARLYNQLRLRQIRHIQLMPNHDHLDEGFQDADVDDAATLSLMLAEQEVASTISGNVHSAKLFNELLGLLSRYESAELEDNNRRQRLLLMADQTVSALYAQVFSPDDNTGEKIYVENKAQKILLVPDEWQQLSVRLPESLTLRNYGLRIDPLNNTGLIHISAICLKHDVTGEPLWEKNSDTGFDACIIEGTALCLSSEKELQIVATGNDSRIILPVMPDIPDVPLTLEVWLRVSRDLCEMASMWVTREDQLQTQNRQIETLNASHEQSVLERTRIKDQLDEGAQENNRLLQLLDQRTGEWEKKRQILEDALERQEKLSREYFAVLAGVEKELAAARDREADFKSIMQLLERDFQALLGSARWQVGDRFTRMGEILLLRKKKPLAVDHMQAVFDQFKTENTTKRSTSQRRREYIRDPDAIKKLNRWMHQLNNDFVALKNSKRWRLGNALVHGLEMITFKSGQAMATDHLENIFKDYEKMSSGHVVEDLKTLQSLLLHPEKDFHAISRSMRWKVGDGIFSFIDTLLFRKKQPTVIDHINAVYQEYNAWRMNK